MVNPLPEELWWVEDVPVTLHFLSYAKAHVKYFLWYIHIIVDIDHIDIILCSGDDGGESRNKVVVEWTEEGRLRDVV